MAQKYLLLVSVFITVSPTVPGTRDLQDAEHWSLWWPMGGRRMGVPAPAFQNLGK